MNKWIAIIVMCLSTYCMKGQGSVEINTSSAVDQMVEKFVSKHRSEETIRGWRIQIITTDDRRKMERAISKFSNLYPGVSYDWSHVAPYYRVSVGAYEDKLDLMDFLLDLKGEFPGVIPVIDNIKKTELIGR